MPLDRPIGPPPLTSTLVIGSLDILLHRGGAAKTTTGETVADEIFFRCDSNESRIAACCASNTTTCAFRTVFSGSRSAPTASTLSRFAIEVYEHHAVPPSL